MPPRQATLLQLVVRERAAAKAADAAEVSIWRARPKPVKASAAAAAVDAAVKAVPPPPPPNPRAPRRPAAAAADAAAAAGAGAGGGDGDAAMAIGMATVTIHVCPRRQYSSMVTMTYDAPRFKPPAAQDSVFFAQYADTYRTRDVLIRYQLQPKLGRLASDAIPELEGDAAMADTDAKDSGTRTGAPRVFSSVAKIVDGQRGYVVGCIRRQRATYEELSLHERFELRRVREESMFWAVQSGASDGALDVLYLHDSSGSCVLATDDGSNVHLDRLFDGMVVALYGQLEPGTSGTVTFRASDILYPGYAPLAPFVERPRPLTATLPQCLILSGLRIGTHTALLSATAESHLARCLTPQLMGAIVDYCTRGDDGLGLITTYLSERPHIVRVILAGNTCSPHAAPARSVMSLADSRDALRRRAKAIADCDVAVARLLRYARVDIVPGYTDPGRATVPRPALSRIIFPACSAHERGRFSACTNPARLGMNGLDVLVTGGEAILDILRHTAIDDPLDAMDMTLRCCHVVPTAPSTISMTPLVSTADALVLTQTPRVYIAGNQSAFGARTIVTGTQPGDTTLLLSVPEFYDSDFTAVIWDPYHTTACSESLHATSVLRRGSR